jgi:predicted  nucleic acid-binding Zn-ribbon protein
MAGSDATRCEHAAVWHRLCTSVLDCDTLERIDPAIDWASIPDAERDYWRLHRCGYVELNVVWTDAGELADWRCPDCGGTKFKRVDLVSDATETVGRLRPLDELNDRRRALWVDIDALGLYDETMPIDQASAARIDAMLGEIDRIGQEIMRDHVDDETKRQMREYAQAKATNARDDWRRRSYWKANTCHDWRCH